MFGVNTVPAKQPKLAFKLKQRLVLDYNLLKMNTGQPMIQKRRSMVRIYAE